MEEIINRKKVGVEFQERVRAPWSSAMFNGYLAVMVLGGLVGVGATFVDVINSGNFRCENYKIAESLGTFFVAVAATALADMIYCDTILNKKAFQIWTAIAIGICVVLLWITYAIKNSLSFLPSILGTGLSVLLWVVANADNKSITEEDNYSKEMRGKGLHGKGWNNQ